MHICFYTETALPFVGGQELAIDAVARRLVAGGQQATVLTLLPRRRLPAAEHATPYPVVRHRRYLSTRYLLGWYGRYLESVYRRTPFDILHVHNVYPAGYVGALWATRRNIPLVVTSHACDIGEESHLLRKPLVVRRIRSVLEQSAAILAISEQVRGRFLALGARSDQIHFVPNGVDTVRFARLVSRPDSLSADIHPGHYLLFLGRLAPRKGADLLLDAYQRIAPTTDVSLVIAGTGEQTELLQAKIAAAGLGNRVHLTGAVEGDHKDYLLQNAICTVIPSRISEGSSLVHLESSAAGVPVVASAVPGLRDAIRHCETGFLFPEENVEALADQLSLAVRHPELMAKAGAAARSAVAEFDWDQVVRRHVNIYETIVGSQCRRAA